MRPSERGSVTPLIIGLALVVALLVAVVVDASAAYLRREGLNALADAAALAATDGLQGERAYLTGLGDGLVVDPGSARRYVAEFLITSGAVQRYPDLGWTVEVRGQRVLVRLRASLDLPLRAPGTARRTTVTGSSSAVVTVGG
ncbi:MAG: pilus assembly protein TadG-related protein [Propionibacteriales bacterium]|nr:pilus assembly protein TadG-related protein [Propionibacteriales bacterium]